MVQSKVRALRSTTLWLVVLLLAATVLLVWRGQLPAPPSSLSQANAAVAHPTSFNVAITGQKTGAFKGEGIRQRDKDKLVGITFAYELISPRDPASGQPTGKRQHKPVTLTKEWGAATPQILNALATNENLTTVLFQFFKTDRTGKEYVFQTVKLTNASISDVSQFTDKSGLFEIDQVSFTFQKIEVTNNDGKTTFIDDWEAPVS